MATSSGKRGARKESQFATVLREAGWRVEGPKPRARFGRTDYFGVLDLLAVRGGSTRLLLAQLTGRTNASAKRSAIDRELPRALLPDAGSTAVVVGAWGYWRRAGVHGWRITQRGARGWRAIGIVSLDGSLAEATGSLVHLLRPYPSRSSPRDDAAERRRRRPNQAEETEDGDNDGSDGTVPTEL